MIRLATKEDVSGLILLLRQYYEEVGQFKCKWNTHKLEQELLLVISSPECDCAVSVHGNEIRGCTISALVTPIYSYDTILECRGVYVDKKHRAGMAGVSLLKRLKKQAVDMGASGISLGASSGIAQQRTERLYKKLGYVRNGSDYILEV